jgi:hypothetical protein
MIASTGPTQLLSLPVGEVKNMLCLEIMQTEKSDFCAESRSLM